jgi:hypothetical protein
MNEKELISQAMTLLGKRTSKRKAAASRRNAIKARAAKNKLRKSLNVLTDGVSNEL